MTEHEMEDLLWAHPEKFLNEPLQPFRRQSESDVGRADLIFTDRIGRFLVVEVKRGRLPREAVGQLHDYFGMLKREFPDKPVELMVVAWSIPEERRLACDHFDIECREIPERRFREVADEVHYSFQSEMHGAGQPGDPQTTKPGGAEKPSQVPTTGRGRGPRFITPEPRSGRAMLVHVPLVRMELSINQLIELLLDGTIRSLPEVEIKRLVEIMAGMVPAVDPSTDRTRVRAWIIARLIGRGLDPECKLYPDFKYVAYPENGRIVDLTLENIATIGDDVPIRILCRRSWFRNWGGNQDCIDYFGGVAKNQEQFYGKDGKGGRFPVRPGTEIPL